MRGDFGGDHGDMARVYYGTSYQDALEDHDQERMQAAIKKALASYYPALALMELVMHSGLAYSEALAEWRYVYGADANLQDAAEREDRS